MSLTQLTVVSHGVLRSARYESVLYPGWLQHLHIFFFLRVSGRKTEVLGTLYVLYNSFKFRKYHIILDCDMALCLILKKSRLYNTLAFKTQII